MDQHPVPQNISSYEFHLVGDMTLKQFFQVAGGVAVAVVMYRLPLPFILKWFIMAIAVLMGVLLAFVPVAGRPFSQWIMAFIKAIYSPTEFHWSETSENTPPAPPPDSGGDQRRSVAKKTTLDVIEEQLFSRFSQIFSHPNLAFSPIQPNPQSPTPNPQPPAPSPVVAEPPPPDALPEAAASLQAGTHQVLQADRIPNTEYRVPVTNNSIPPPDYPNLLTGQVLDSAGSYLEGVILELSDAAGLPVRALRSNKLGQFMTATPLPQGTYTLIAEKEGLQFSPLTLQAENKIISPIVIKAQLGSSQLVSS